MAVVINEFEVVAEPAPPPAAAQSQAQRPAPPPDVERVLAELRARERRVRAY